VKFKKLSTIETAISKTSQHKNRIFHGKQENDFFKEIFALTNQCISKCQRCIQHHFIALLGFLNFLFFAAVQGAYKYGGTGILFKQLGICYNKNFWEELICLLSQ
jgi:hypothetical protein